DFGLLFGRQEKALLALFLRALQFVELLLGFLQGGFEFLDFALITFLGLGLHFFDAGERLADIGAAANRGQVVVAAHLLDEILGEIQIVIQGLRDHPEDAVHLADRKLVIQHIRVAKQHDRIIGLGFLERIPGWLGLGGLGVILLLVLGVFRFAIRKGRF